MFFQPFENIYLTYVLVYKYVKMLFTNSLAIAIRDRNLINLIPNTTLETTATASVARYGVGVCDVNFVSD